MPIRRPIFLVPLALALTACGGGGHGDLGQPKALIDVVEPVQPAVPAAPYAAALADCTFNGQRSESCLLSQLPFLGQDVATLNVDRIMERVIVSHPWMAQRFREVLLTLPQTLLQMFRPITAVVIGSKVRPSFYFAATGAIYLDPEGLWLTPAERATIDTTPDARTNFGQDLQFRAIWRYVQNNDYAYEFYPASYQGSRTVEDIRLFMGRLLAHELTHAGDFSPVANLAGLPRSKTVLQAINDQSEQWVSTRLDNALPQRSSVWPGIAQVLYAGRRASFPERRYTPPQAGNFVEQDRASDAYGYFSQFEDLAMISEELLSRCLFDMQRDFAISDRPSQGRDFTVGWGMRGRIGEPQVKEAARLAIAELIPDSDFSACLNALPAPVRLKAGQSWQANLDPSGTGSSSAKAASLRRDDSALPPG